MESQQLNLDVISNNLANVNTTGFKRSKAEFQELLYQTTRAPGAESTVVRSPGDRSLESERSREKSKRVPLSMRGGSVRSTLGEVSLGVNP